MQKDYRNAKEEIEGLREALKDINERLDELDNALTDSVENVQPELTATIEESNKALTLKIEALEERIKTLQNHLDYEEPFKNQIRKMTTSLTEILKNQFEDKNISGRLSTLTSFAIANLIGTAALIGLICYILVSIMP